MDGKLNNELVVCCFCGESLEINEAIIIVVYININEEETQQFYCHREHFVNAMHKTIFLHPSLTDIE
jgi:hypothetical protein